MNSTHDRSTVIVLGAGVGGLVAAHRLRRRLSRTHRVLLIDRETTHLYAPSLLWTLTGARHPDRFTRSLLRVRRHGIDFEQAEIVGLDPQAGAVHTTAGTRHYDHLILALGASMDPGATPGFDAVHDIYRPEGALAARDAIGAMQNGTITVAVAGAPYKCPAAPWEAALLVDAALRARKVREHCSVRITTPEPQPMPVAGPAIGDAVLKLLADRDIEVLVDHALDAIDPDARMLRFADGTTSAFDVALGIPRHRPPALLADSGLAEPGAYLTVDPQRLDVQGTPGISAIGDMAAIRLPDGKMLPKAGVFAHAQARVVADRVSDSILGKTPTAEFDGHGACFLEIGSGRAAYATGDFYASDGPQLKLHPPSRRWHLSKVAFERYWLTRWWW